MRQVEFSSPKSITEARAKGAGFYYTGLPCKRGHISVRYASNGSCLDCFRDVWKSAKFKSAKKAYYDIHKDEHHAQVKKWAKENIEKRREIVRKSSAKNRATRIAWEKKNKEKLAEKRRTYYLANKERLNLRNAEWKKENKHIVVAYNAARRAREKNAEGRFTEADIDRMLIKQGNKCNICSCDLKRYHVDHVIPLVKGGSNWPGNLQLLCPSCNSRKWAN